MLAALRRSWTVGGRDSLRGYRYTRTAQISGRRARGTAHHSGAVYRELWADAEMLQLFFSALCPFLSPMLHMGAVRRFTLGDSSRDPNVATGGYLVYIYNGSVAA